MFQNLLHTITTFIIVTVVAATGMLHRPTFTPNKPVDFSIATPSAMVSASPKPSPILKPSLQAKQKTVQLEQTDTLPNPPATSAPARQVYQINPMGDVSSLPDNQKQQYIDIYNKFIQTPDLQYMTPSQQSEVFKQIANTYLDNYKRQLLQEESQLKENVSQLKQQLNQVSPTPTPIPTSPPFQPDSAIIAKLDELRQTLSSIQNQTVAQSVMEGKKQGAYSKWMQNNFDAYAVISGNSYYLNLLNSIRRAYGI